MSDRKLIVFDFDGTLVDAHAEYTNALREFSESRNLPWDTDKMALGYTTPGISDLGWGVPIDQQLELFKALNAFYFTEMVEQKRFMPTLFPDTLSVLEELSQDYDLGVITARDRKSLLAIFEHYNLEKYFLGYRSLCCARDRGYAIKPDAGAVYCLLGDTRHHVENIVVVGDTTADIGMANNAGAKSIAALWGVHPPEKLQAADPTVMLRDMRDLPKTIRQMFV